MGVGRLVSGDVVNARPKEPGREWSRIAAFGWQSGPVCVISTLDMAKLPRREDVGPQWHISITNCGKRPKPHHVRRALRAFEMVDAELDNHHPGNAQHYFMPVDPAMRVSCECADGEALVTEPDGYQWSSDPTVCRACEIAHVVNRPCPTHGLP